MRKSVASMVVLFVAALSSSTALGQPFGRTFVSAQVGSDANNCLPTAPCRTFARALSNTAANGEIIVLDSGGYGSSLLIDKAVQIQAPAGVYAGMTTGLGSTITINAGTSDSVVLNGLTINSSGGVNGVDVDSVGALHLDGCTISGFSNSGVRFDVAGELFVRDSTFRRNSGSAGIFLIAATGNVLASIDEATFEKNFAGLWLEGNAKAMIRDSLAARNEYGYISQNAGTELMVENSIATHNATGLIASATVIRVSNSTVTNNGLGFVNSGSASFLSRGNNTVEGNTTNTEGMISSYTPR